MDARRQRLAERRSRNTSFLPSAKAQSQQVNIRSSEKVAEQHAARRQSQNSSDQGDHPKALAPPPVRTSAFPNFEDDSTAGKPKDAFPGFQEQGASASSSSADDDDDDDNEEEQSTEQGKTAPATGQGVKPRQTEAESSSSDESEESSSASAPTQTVQDKGQRGSAASGGSAGDRKTGAPVSSPADQSSSGSSSSGEGEESSSETSESKSSPVAAEVKPKEDQGVTGQQGRRASGNSQKEPDTQAASPAVAAGGTSSSSSNSSSSGSGERVSSPEDPPVAQPNSSSSPRARRSSQRSNSNGSNSSNPRPGLNEEGVVARKDSETAGVNTLMQGQEQNGRRGSVQSSASSTFSVPVATRGERGGAWDGRDSADGKVEGKGRRGNGERRLSGGSVGEPSRGADHFRGWVAETEEKEKEEAQLRRTTDDFSPPVFSARLEDEATLNSALKNERQPEQSPPVMEADSSLKRISAESLEVKEVTETKKPTLAAMARRVKEDEKEKTAEMAAEKEKPTLAAMAQRASQESKAAAKDAKGKGGVRGVGRLMAAFFPGRKQAAATEGGEENAKETVAETAEKSDAEERYESEQKSAQKSGEASAEEAKESSKRNPPKQMSPKGFARAANLMNLFRRSDDTERPPAGTDTADVIALGEKKGTDTAAEEATENPTVTAAALPDGLGLAPSAPNLDPAQAQQELMPLSQPPTVEESEGRRKREDRMAKIRAAKAFSQARPPSASALKSAEASKEGGGIQIPTATEFVGQLTKAVSGILHSEDLSEGQKTKSEKGIKEKKMEKDLHSASVEVGPDDPTNRSFFSTGTFYPLSHSRFQSAMLEIKMHERLQQRDLPLPRGACASLNELLADFEGVGRRSGLSKPIERADSANARFRSAGKEHSTLAARQDAFERGGAKSSLGCNGEAPLLVTDSFWGPLCLDREREPRRTDRSQPHTANALMRQAKCRQDGGLILYPSGATRAEDFEEMDLGGFAPLSVIQKRDRQNELTETQREAELLRLMENMQRNADMRREADRSLQSATVLGESFRTAEAEAEGRIATSRALVAEKQRESPPRRPLNVRVEADGVLSPVRMSPTSLPKSTVAAEGREKVSPVSVRSRRFPTKEAMTELDGSSRRYTKGSSVETLELPYFGPIPPSSLPRPGALGSDTLTTEPRRMAREFAQMPARLFPFSSRQGGQGLPGGRPGERATKQEEAARVWKAKLENAQMRPDETLAESVDENSVVETFLRRAASPSRSLNRREEVGANKSSACLCGGGAMFSGFVPFPTPLALSGPWQHDHVSGVGRVNTPEDSNGAGGFGSRENRSSTPQASRSVQTVTEGGTQTCAGELARAQAGASQGLQVNTAVQTPNDADVQTDADPSSFPSCLPGALRMADAQMQTLAETHVQTDPDEQRGVSVQTVTTSGVQTVEGGIATLSDLSPEAQELARQGMNMKFLTPQKKRGEEEYPPMDTRITPDDARKKKKNAKAVFQANRWISRMFKSKSQLGEQTDEETAGDTEVEEEGEHADRAMSLLEAEKSVRFRQKALPRAAHASVFMSVAPSPLVEPAQAQENPPLPLLKGGMSAASMFMAPQVPRAPQTDEYFGSNNVTPREDPLATTQKDPLQGAGGFLDALGTEHEKHSWKEEGGVGGTEKDPNVQNLHLTRSPREGEGEGERGMETDKRSSTNRMHVYAKASTLGAPRKRGSSTATAGPSPEYSRPEIASLPNEKHPSKEAERRASVEKAADVTQSPSLLPQTSAFSFKPSQSTSSEGGVETANGKDEQQRGGLRRRESREQEEPQNRRRSSNQSIVVNPPFVDADSQNRPSISQNSDRVAPPLGQRSDELPTSDSFLKKEEKKKGFQDDDGSVEEMPLVEAMREAADQQARGSKLREWETPGDEEGGDGQPSPRFPSFPHEGDEAGAEEEEERENDAVQGANSKSEKRLSDSIKEDRRRRIAAARAGIGLSRGSRRESQGSVYQIPSKEGTQEDLQAALDREEENGEDRVEVGRLSEFVKLPEPHENVQIESGALRSHPEGSDASAEEDEEEDEDGEEEEEEETDSEEREGKKAFEQTSNPAISAESLQEPVEKRLKGPRRQSSAEGFPPHEAPPSLRQGTRISVTLPSKTKYRRRVSEIDGAAESVQSLNAAAEEEVLKKRPSSLRFQTLNLVGADVDDTPKAAMVDLNYRQIDMQKSGSDRGHSNFVPLDNFLDDEDSD
uniref:Uncharacterized protein n=1 Tax=Chromera velia CCMP2878 TaxID=1169474 RepID=A0A0G4FBH4_9ALVE|eukprot:Cvel_16158.t1-p1 / transcript=Cvel_16158.t1 / gene=Cvel_16158 / organism=Chromera_velia_CCMP2878 / gene_product=hypothetical protein / transcript_product=hypothetical protein / location=Cvel_scaffold1231:12999-20507(+) / protein_length=2205 / sequence_SO=supercontig / SO=protein_coding / is_pseudo=false